MTAADLVLLLAAGLAAGITGSAGGTAALISYPALLAVGIGPLTANVTNAVAFVAAWPGSALGSRPELRGQGPWLRRWAPLVAAGSAAGAALLLLTPASAFGRVVPFLVAFASLAMLFQPAIASWREDRCAHDGAHDQASQRGRRRGGLRAVHRAGHRVLLPGGLVVTSVYDGYWGAGAGVMTLALLMITTGQPLPQSNAVKNMLLGIADVACCIVFVLYGPIDWAAAGPMAAGSLAGSTIGPFLARHIPEGVLCVVVGLAGLGLAVHLWTAR